MDTTSSTATRVTFPRDWRDHLARAINERDLARIETLIGTGHEHHHTKFNDPLIADAFFLLQLAQDNTALHSSSSNSSFNKPRTATRSKVANDKAGCASWVAQPIASLAQSRPGERSSNTLRERVSQLREMALFPDSRKVSSSSSSAYNNRSVSAMTQMSVGRGGDASVYSASAWCGGTGGGVNRSSSSASPTAAAVEAAGREAEEAAMAMGVPAVWIDPTTAAIPNLPSRDASPNRSSLAPSSHQTSPQSRYHHSSSGVGMFDDPNVSGAALRLHSFVHSEDEPTVKSSRLFQAYVSADRLAPRDTSTTPASSASRPPSHQVSPVRNNTNPQHQQQQQPVVVSPPSPAAAAASSFPNRQQDEEQQQQQRLPSVASVQVSSPSQSPEHHRLIRKLRHESVAPEGAEMTRMLRFLAATEAMERGTLEQSELNRRVAAFVPNPMGVMHSRGISSNRTAAPTVFLDN